jgi:hypothetical protein
VRRFAFTLAAIALSVPSVVCAETPANVESTPEAPLAMAEIATIQQLCETVSIQYARYLDGKDWENLPLVFSEDGVWEVLGNRMEGHDQIRNYWKSRTADWAPTHGRVHQISNQVIEVIDRDHARGTSTVFIYFFDTAEGANEKLVPTLIAQNDDEYVRTADGWKLKHRAVGRIANVGAH